MLQESLKGAFRDIFSLDAAQLDCADIFGESP